MDFSALGAGGGAARPVGGGTPGAPADPGGDDDLLELVLETEIASRLIEKGFSGVNFALSNGEVVIEGRVEERKESVFSSVLAEIRKMPGVRMVKNFAVMTTADTSRVDLSSKFKVTG